MPYDYTTRGYAKEALGMSTTDAADDAYIGRLITRASRFIDRFCNRVLVAEEATRYFHAQHDVEGDDLLLDEDLVTVTTLTNGDSVAIASTAYVLLPQNQTPSHSIRIKSDSGVFWTWVDDPNEAISVAGAWGFASNTPADIQQATLRLVTWWYKSRKNPFQQVGTSQGGLVQVAPSMPEDIREILSPFVKWEFPAV